MPADERPDPAAVLARLKDFQRATVEHVFRRLYRDADATRRYLIADEVGLGKTLVARGVIAKAIDHLWDRTDRIDIVYVCSNADIARQNIDRLNVTGRKDFVLSSRLTLLPVTVQNLDRRRVNFISFTPGTSFEMASNAGWADERALLYWLLHEPWDLSRARATRVLHGRAKIDGFRWRVDNYERDRIHAGMRAQFAAGAAADGALRARFESRAERLPRAGAAVPDEMLRERRLLVADLRRLLAATCLKWLAPDVVVLDEFQRFKDLLAGDGDDATDASRLAHHLFSYQDAQADPATAARVLLLSATPYRMYTRAGEADDHHADFAATLGFLAGDKSALAAELRAYREALFRSSPGHTADLVRAKDALEAALRRVMVRTERLALSPDRNGMLVEAAPAPTPLEPADVEQYLRLHELAAALGVEDALEYWKSAPYLLNFMDGYDLKQKADAAGPHLAPVVQAAGGELREADLQRYREIDPANPRLRHLFDDTVGRGAWKLLWLPPTLPYYAPGGPFADPAVAGFTNRLVFSCWKVVPKVVGAVLSYAAEREMARSLRKKARNTPEARRKQLLRFAKARGRPTGLPALALVYPCRTLATAFDPLRTRGQTLPAVLAAARAAIEPHLGPLVATFGTPDAPADERWYWAAPLLLDRAAGAGGWLDRDATAGEWSAGADAKGWRRHVAEARAVIRDGRRLGSPPVDLPGVLAELAVAGPGVAALRAVERATGVPDGRPAAAPLAYAFLHLFNQPEVTAYVRDRKKELPYWQSVLRYCAAGNLQAVLDEYTHVLADGVGPGSTAEAVAATVSAAAGRALGLRTGIVRADLYEQGVPSENPYPFRARFALRFGDQAADDGREPTRADAVRAAFNSPFWPFVLATTSVGQEGLDFHPYCHAVVHWNLPSNPVDLEQREGRVHRYKGHAVRKNVAVAYGAAVPDAGDPWAALFAAAAAARPAGANDMVPYWVATGGPARIERYVPCLPLGRDAARRDALRRSLVLYRMVFGQNRQEDVVNYLAARPLAEAEAAMAAGRIDLGPPPVAIPAGP